MIIMDKIEEWLEEKSYHMIRNTSDENYFLFALMRLNEIGVIPRYEAIW